MTSPAGEGVGAPPGDARCDARSRAARERQLLADRELVDAVLDGDEGAFLSIARRWHRAMVHVARCHVSSDEVADEVVRSSWRAVLDLLGGWQGRMSLAAFVARVVAARARSRAASEDGNGPTGPGSAEPREPVDPRLALRSAVEALPPTHRFAWTLRDVVGCSVEEASAALGVSELEYLALLHGARSRVSAQLRASLSGRAHP